MFNTLIPTLMYINFRTTEESFEKSNVLKEFKEELNTKTVGGHAWNSHEFGNVWFEIDLSRATTDNANHFLAVAETTGQEIFFTEL